MRRDAVEVTGGPCRASNYDDDPECEAVSQRRTCGANSE